MFESLHEYLSMVRQMLVTSCAILYNRAITITPLSSRPSPWGQHSCR
jgi:hypothetical protein